MIKSKSIWILISSFIMVFFISVAVIFNNIDAREDFTNSVKIDGDGYAETTCEIRSLQLHPSESKDYSIEVAPEFGGEYEITINFNEITNGGLKEFVNVSVSIGDKIYTYLLKNLLDEKNTIKILQNFSKEKPLELIISYAMPYEVGNEAQGVFADFDVKIIFNKA